MKSYKLIAITILTLLLINGCVEQDLPQTEIFIIDFFEDRGWEHDTIACTEQSNDYRLNELVNSIATDSRALGNTNSVTLTQSEKSMIIDSLKSSKSNRWQKELSSRFKVISKDTLHSIFNDEKKGWNYFYRNYHSSLYSFTKPIFFRDNTLCVFYWDNGTEGEFCIYKKTWLGWKKYVVINGWMT